MDDLPPGIYTCVKNIDDEVVILHGPERGAVLNIPGEVVWHFGIGEPFTLKIHAPVYLPDGWDREQ